MRDAHQEVEGRETDILNALGISWTPKRKHICCPFPDHDDKNPSWRWDAQTRHWFCTCGTGSVFDAVMRIKGGDFKEAVEFSRSVTGTLAHREPKVNAKSMQDVQISHVCAEALPKPIDLRHAKLGKPKSANIWPYHNEKTEIVEVRVRYEKDGGKEVLPWIWDGKKWLNKQAPSPRPLFALPDIWGDSDAPILFVEGEKAACAAARSFPDYVVTTSSGGCKAYRGTDFSPLMGRHITIWPDNDEPGQEYAKAIAEYARNAGAASVRIVSVPDGWPESWDLGDATPDGVTEADLFRIFKEAKPFEKHAAKQYANGHDRLRELKTPPIEIVAAFQRDEKNQLYRNEHNVKHALFLAGIKISYDEFCHEYRIEGLEGYGPLLNDDAIDELYLQVQRDHALKPSKADFDRIILAEGRRHRFHPVRTYLNTLEWDGQERIDEWLITYLGAEDDRHGVNRALGRVMLLAAVRRVRQPGCKFDPMLVLEGEQYVGKSSAIAALCHNPEWFTDNLDLSMAPKEIIELTAGKWLIEMGELAGMRRSEVEHVKSLVSRQVDEARLAYGRSKSRRPRQCVFFATTNQKNYLIDETGNRRFLPVWCSKIDIESLRRDRDQLWAEASHFEATGETLELPIAIRDALKAIQSQRELEDEWWGPVRRWLDDNFPLSADLFKDQRTTIAEVAESALGIKKDKLESTIEKRVARAMRKADWYMALRSAGHRYWKRQETQAEAS